MEANERSQAAWDAFHTTTTYTAVLFQVVPTKDWKPTFQSRLATLWFLDGRGLGKCIVSFFFIPQVPLYYKLTEPFVVPWRLFRFLASFSNQFPVLRATLRPHGEQN